MNNYNFILLVFVIFIIIRVYKKFNNKENYENKITIIYTCATYFDFEKQDKWTSFCNGIDSILKYHPNILNTINKWYIVNEYSDNPKKNWKKLLEDKYPFIELYQKTKKEKGHPFSINIMLDKIKPYTYWINWEDSWYASKPFLYDAISVMSITNISQLQFTRWKGDVNWLNIDKDRLEFNTFNYNFVKISPTKNIHKIFKNIKEELYDNTIWNQEWIDNWPLYSLLPSINRVSDYNFGYFLTDLPAIKFELEFAYRWINNGNIKAVMEDGPVIRDEHVHVSTHFTNIYSLF
jgi:hypothetical protein